MIPKIIKYSGEQKKVLKIISDEYPFIGYSYLRKMLRLSDIRLNGKKIKTDIDAQNGDIIEFFYNEKNFPFYNSKALYEDENVIVCYKPKKISSQGKNSFEEFMKEKVNSDLILCHRLDTNTDGLLIFAKNENIFEEVKKLFKSGGIEKHYLALVKGIIKDSGMYSDFIIKDSQKGKVFVYKEKKPGSKEAKLFYQILGIKDGNTLTDINLITGRTHQIRAQMAFHGHPVIGDWKYGEYSANKNVGAKCQMLTAYKIIFNIKSGPLKYLDKKIIELEISEF